MTALGAWRPLSERNPGIGGREIDLGVSGGGDRRALQRSSNETARAAFQKPHVPGRFGTDTRNIGGYAGERAGARTRDLLIKSQMLYQLSYALSKGFEERA